ncbi:hypothetical protein Vretifemale_11467, partial [Volvox reticuliferus]
MATAAPPLTLFTGNRRLLPSVAARTGARGEGPLRPVDNQWEGMDPDPGREEPAASILWGGGRSPLLGAKICSCCSSTCISSSPWRLAVFVDTYRPGTPARRVSRSGAAADRCMANQ